MKYGVDNQKIVESQRILASAEATDNKQSSVLGVAHFDVDSFLIDSS